MVLNALVNNPPGQPRPRYHRHDRR
jgi:hypothetical protein